MHSAEGVEQDEVGEIIFQKPLRMGSLIADLALHAGDFEMSRDECGEVFIILSDDDEWLGCLVYLIKRDRNSVPYFRVRVVLVCPVNCKEYVLEM